MWKLIIAERRLTACREQEKEGPEWELSKTDAVRTAKPWTWQRWCFSLSSTLDIWGRPHRPFCLRRLGSCRRTKLEILCPYTGGRQPCKRKTAKHILTLETHSEYERASTSTAAAEAGAAAEEVPQSTTASASANRARARNKKKICSAASANAAWIAAPATYQRQALLLDYHLVLSFLSAAYLVRYLTTWPLMLAINPNSK